MTHDRPFDLTTVPAEGAPTTRLANLVILEALQQGAEQIHFHSDGSTIRYMFDGNWRVMMMIPTAAFSPLINRIRVMANLDRTKGHTRQEGVVTVTDRQSTTEIGVVVQYTEEDKEEIFIALPREQGGFDDIPRIQ